jgi:hypothetical protein
MANNATENNTFLSQSVCLLYHDTHVCVSRNNVWDCSRLMFRNVSSLLR